jgi:hypothetical protein
MRRLFCDAVADFASAAIRRCVKLGGWQGARDASVFAYPSSLILLTGSTYQSGVDVYFRVHRHAKSLCEGDLYTQQRQPLEAWYNDHLAVFLADVLCEHGLRSGKLGSMIKVVGNLMWVWRMRLQHARRVGTGKSNAHFFRYRLSHSV